MVIVLFVYLCIVSYDKQQDSRVHKQSVPLQAGQSKTSTIKSTAAMFFYRVHLSQDGKSHSDLWPESQNHKLPFLTTVQLLDRSFDVVLSWNKRRSEQPSNHCLITRLKTHTRVVFSHKTHATSKKSGAAAGSSWVDEKALGLQSTCIAISPYG